MEFCPIVGFRQQKSDISSQLMSHLAYKNDQLYLKGTFLAS
jgi:hypothetical protein